MGVLFGLGSIGQVFVPLLIELFHGTSPSGTLDFRWSTLIMAVLGLAGFLFVMRATSPRRGSAACTALPIRQPGARNFAPSAPSHEYTGIRSPPHPLMLRSA